jgi:hypothetical protein
MMIKSFGCSFIWGSDLSDSGRIGGSAPYSRLTWPAILSRQLKIHYSCHAFPGIGNLRILEQVLNQAESASQDFFVIGWSFIDRFDYHEQDRWRTLLPVLESTGPAEFYYRKLQSEYVDKLSTLIHIRTAIDVLNQKRIPFLMTYMDPLLLDQTWHVSDAVVSLQQYVQPYLHLFDNQTFLEWSRAHNYPISAHMHPLDSAHAAAADIILPVAKKILNQS